jgi:hypothetical protein
MTQALMLHAHYDKKFVESKRLIERGRGPVPVIQVVQSGN